MTPREQKLQEAAKEQIEDRIHDTIYDSIYAEGGEVGGGGRAANKCLEICIEFATSPAAQEYWQGWTAVEDGLPEVNKKFGESDYLLCYTEYNEQVVCWFNRQGEWIVANYKADSLPHAHKVTHWMPLLSPPKTETP